MSKNKNIPAKLHIKKGDNVVVIAGSSKGVEGEVLEVNPKNYTAVVEGANTRKKHTKPTNESQGGIVEFSAPIHISNIMLKDPSTGKPCRIGRKKVDGSTVRYSKSSGEIIK